MTNLRFSDRNKGGAKKDGEGEGANGQGGITPEQLKQLIDAVSSKDGNSDGGNSQPNAQPQPPHNPIMTDDAVQALEKSLGKDAASVLINILDNVSQQTTRDSSLILGQLDKITGSLSEKLDSQSSMINSLGSKVTSDLSSVHGFDQVFNEDNKEDLGEMLKIITEKSGGLFDAEAAFDKAAESGDNSTLLGFKEKFDDYLSHKYKDHQSVSGDNGTTTRTDMRQRQQLESEIDSLNRQIDAELSGVNKDYTKVLELQDKVREKADSLIN